MTVFIEKETTLAELKISPSTMFGVRKLCMRLLRRAQDRQDKAESEFLDTKNEDGAYFGCG